MNSPKRPTIRREPDGRLAIDGPDIMTPSDVAAVTRVNPKTVVRWANDGRVRSFRTIGGDRRFYRADVEDALNAAQNGGPQ